MLGVFSHASRKSRSFSASSRPRLTLTVAPNPLSVSPHQSLLHEKLKSFPPANATTCRPRSSSPASKYIRSLLSMFILSYLQTDAQQIIPPDGFQPRGEFRRYRLRPFSITPITGRPSVPGRNIATSDPWFARVAVPSRENQRRSRTKKLSFFGFRAHRSLGVIASPRRAVPPGWKLVFSTERRKSHITMPIQRTRLTSAAYGVHSFAGPLIGGVKAQRK